LPKHGPEGVIVGVTVLVGVVVLVFVFVFVGVNSGVIVCVGVILKPGVAVMPLITAPSYAHFLAKRDPFLVLPQLINNPPVFVTDLRSPHDHGITY
jgi:hypothetical protein